MELVVGDLLDFLVLIATPNRPRGFAVPTGES